jgi:Transposase DDE domain
MLTTSSIVVRQRGHGSGGLPPHLLLDRSDTMHALCVRADRSWLLHTEHWMRALVAARLAFSFKATTSNSKAEGRFGKQDFRYVPDEDVYICPAGERLTYSFTTEDKGLVLRRYRTHACRRCSIKHSCTTAKERLISRWEHEHVLEAVQRRLDEHPEKMRQRRETVEHPFGSRPGWAPLTS